MLSFVAVAVVVVGVAVAVAAAALSLQQLQVSGTCVPHAAHFSPFNFAWRFWRILLLRQTRLKIYMKIYDTFACTWLSTGAGLLLGSERDGGCRYNSCHQVGANRAAAAVYY